MAALGEAEAAIREELTTTNFQFPQGTLLKAGKISRGENYRGLPYWILDYPRKFLKEETFAFRTMVWWGHEISCTLHVSGPPTKAFSSAGDVSDVYFCINDTPWEYHFDEDNYQKLSTLYSQQINEHIERNRFVKVAYKWPLERLSDLPDLSSKSLQMVLQLLSHNT